MSTNQAINHSDNLGFQSITIACVDCGNDFAFTADEQKFFQNHGFVNQPKRCPNCRVVRRVLRNGQGATTTSKVDCAECGSQTTVPFLPMQGKPVYCSSCFIKNGGGKKKHVFIN